MDTSEEVEIQSTLILVKHALPELDAEVPAKEWQLGDKGLSQAKKFANFLSDNLELDQTVYSSDESKASETAMVIAESLGLTHKTVPELREFDRPALPILDEKAHQKRNEEIFKNKDKPVLGTESANQALARFEEGIKKVLAEPLDDERVVVSHGTVISLFLDKYNDEIDGFDIWKKLSCPSYVVVSLPEFKVLELNGQPLSN